MSVVLNNTTVNSPINDLPEEMFVNILSNLSLKDLATVSQVTKQWNRIRKEVWKKMVPSLFPKDWEEDEVFKGKLISELMISTAFNSKKTHSEKYAKQIVKNAGDNMEVVVFTENSAVLPQKVTLKKPDTDIEVELKAKKASDDNSLMAWQYSLNKTNVPRRECFKRMEKKYKIWGMVILSILISLIVVGVIVIVKKNQEVNQNNGPTAPQLQPLYVNPVYLQNINR